MKGRILRSLAAVSLLSGACGPADEVEVQPLPSLQRATPEARAGLPEIAGVWRFAGWELAPGDSASLELPLPSLGRVWLRTQRRDSVGGFYLPASGRAPLAGEVRRDSVVSLVTFLAPGDGRFLTGRVTRDTLWMELSTLTEPGSWPRGARVAMVRTPVASPFVRIHGAPPPPPPPDTTQIAALDSARADSAAAGAAPPASPLPPRPGAAAPGQRPAVTPARPETRPSAAPPAAGARPPGADTPQRTQPQRQPPPPAQPARRPPPDLPLLGDPVRDTARDTTGVVPRR